MKYLSVIDRIYYYIYSFIKKTPSKDSAYESAAMFMPAIVGVHVITILMFIIKYMLRIQFLRDDAKLIIVIGGVFLCVGSYYYYISQKNGERIVKKYMGVINERRSVIIGALVFFETILFMFIFWAIIILLQRLIG